MSYTIVFADKVVKLSDGRIIYFMRSGCNNDKEGRSPHDFQAEIYTVEDFKAKAEKYMKDDKPYTEGGGWDLKIRSKHATLYDLGKHMLTMLKRAENFEDLEKYGFFGKAWTGVDVKKGNNLGYELVGSYTPKEWRSKSYNEIVKLRADGYSIWKQFSEIVRTEDEIIQLIENQDNYPISLHIGKKRK